MGILFLLAGAALVIKWLFQQDLSWWMPFVGMALMVLGWRLGLKPKRVY
jgi:drug/metabolite transporter superfamily protein YnfA